MMQRAGLTLLLLAACLLCLVTVIEKAAFEEVPDAGPIGRALLVILIGIAAVIVIRMKLG